MLFSVTLPIMACSRSPIPTTYLMQQVAEKNPRNVPEKLKLMKYDPIVGKHVLFEEQKLK